MANPHAATRAGISSEPRGRHWVAWIPDVNGKPERSVVLVGKTRKEAEEKAGQWRDEITGASA